MPTAPVNTTLHGMMMTDGATTRAVSKNKEKLM